MSCFVYFQVAFNLNMQLRLRIYDFGNLMSKHPLHPKELGWVLMNFNCHSVFFKFRFCLVEWKAIFKNRPWYTEKLWKLDAKREISDIIAWPFVIFLWHLIYLDIILGGFFFKISESSENSSMEMGIIIKLSLYLLSALKLRVCTCKCFIFFVWWVCL